MSTRTMTTNIIFILGFITSISARCQWSALPGKRPMEMRITCSEITSENIHQEVSSVSAPTSYYTYIFENSSIQSFPMNVFASMKKGNVLYLYLNNSKMETIQTGAFSGLLEVREIYLQFNSLDVISRGCFNSLFKLQILDLSNNNINLIEDDAFNGSNELRQILLNSNNITYVPQVIFHSLKKLQFVNLSNNNINILALSFSNFAVFKTLSLNNNKISQINCQAIHPSYLDVIELEDNFLTEFNGSCFPKIVEHVNLKNNLINRIYNVTVLNSLKYLDVSDNYISIVNVNEFVTLKKLSNLLLEGNNISELTPGVFKNLTSLYLLNVSRNSIKLLDFGVFNGLEKLEQLDLSYNQLEILEEDVFLNMKNLNVLNVSYNNLQYINLVKLKTFTSLQQIDLIGNNISCQKLSSMFSYKLKLTILESIHHNVTNVNGIPCTNFNVLLKNYESKFNYNTLRDIRFFFETDFKNTSFFKFFSKNVPVEQRNEDTLPNNDKLLALVSKNNAIFIIFTMIVIVVCGLLVTLIIMLKNVLKRRTFPLQEPEMHLL